MIEPDWKELAPSSHDTAEHAGETVAFVALFAFWSFDAGFARSAILLTRKGFGERFMGSAPGFSILFSIAGMGLLFAAPFIVFVEPASPLGLIVQLWLYWNLFALLLYAGHLLLLLGEAIHEAREVPDHEAPHSLHAGDVVVDEPESDHVSALAARAFFICPPVALHLWISAATLETWSKRCEQQQKVERRRYRDQMLEAEDAADIAAEVQGTPRNLRDWVPVKSAADDWPAVAEGYSIADMMERLEPEIYGLMKRQNGLVRRRD